jgi:hypothetical protein
MMCPVAVKASLPTRGPATSTHWRNEYAILDNGFLRRTIDDRTWFARVR